jgi:hypothetical protein
VPPGVDHGPGPAERLARRADQTVRAAHALGYVDSRHRRRLVRLLGFLVDQREDAVASLPTGPAQLVPLRHVTVVQRLVVGSPPPSPRLRSGIRDRDLP